MRCPIPGPCLSATTPCPENSIFASDPDTSDAFGDAVSILGDRIVVGAKEEGGNTGAVYVFDRDANEFYPELSKNLG